MTDFMNLMTEFVTYFTSNLGYILSLTYNHIQYSLFAILLSILIGVPLGLIIYNFKNLDKPVLTVVNLIQAIPSLALLGFAVPYFGIGASTAIFMVVLYSLLPILKNTYTGLSNINRDTLEAAKGIGMTNLQILFKVQIPLALPVIMAGIRISSVSAVGLMTIAAYIGAEVLGTLVISGIHILNSAMILSGAIPACALALGMDFLMLKVEKAVTPVSLQLTTANLTSEAILAIKRSRKRTIISITSVFAVIAIVMSVTFFNQPKDVIVVGSKEAVEGRIVGHIIAEVIEENTDLTVERKLGLGGTTIAYNALLKDQIHIYPEYTGTLLATVLENNFVPGTSSDDVYKQVKSYVYTTDSLHALTPFDVNNTYVLAVRRDTAEQYNLTTISDLAKVSSRLLIGCTPEFAGREDGLIGIRAAYDMEFKDTLNFTGTLIYSAIDGNEVDVITAFSTDSLIGKYDLVMLEDDLSFFPPYHLLPLVSDDLYNAYPDIVALLEELAPLLDDTTMGELNGQVVEDGLDASVVAHNFLVDVGMVDAK